MSDNSLKKGRYTRHSNKIGLYSTSHDRIGFLNNNNDVVLSFPFKDTVLEAGMNKEDTGREERFLHQEVDGADIDTLFEPKTLTNFKVFGSNQKVEDINFFDESGNLQQNLLIKGNNLLALHSLSERLAGKVKLIYIDPPYNTDNDGFKYNDSFNHSSWLTFMKNRLQVARNLLSDDGVIFVHCDDNEQAYLKVLMDEIFGRDNFIGTIPRKTRNGKSDVSYKFSQDYDWIISFTKGASKTTNLFKRDVDRKYYKSDDYSERWRLSDLTKQTTPQERPNSDFTMINPKNGDEYPVNPKRSWAVTKDTFMEYYRQGRIVFPDDYDFLNITRPAMRVFESSDEGKKGYISSDFLINLENGFENTKGNKQIDELFGNRIFSYAKPEELIERIISATTEIDDLVLDYHVGSGTTAAVAHKMGRRWIGVEQMDYIEDTTKERLKKVIEGEQGGISKAVGWQGGGSFVYFELKKYNQDFLDKIMIASSKGELDEVYNEMAKNAFLKFWFDKNEFEKDENFRSLDLDRRKELLIGILDENQLYLNYADMRDSRYHVTDEEMALTDLFYGVNND